MGEFKDNDRDMLSWVSTVQRRKPRTCFRSFVKNVENDVHAGCRRAYRMSDDWRTLYHVQCNGEPLQVRDLETRGNKEPRERGDCVYTAIPAHSRRERVRFVLFVRSTQTSLMHTPKTDTMVPSGGGSSAVNATARNAL